MADTNAGGKPAREINQLTDQQDIADTLEVGGHVLFQKEMGSQKAWCQILGWSPGRFLFLDGPHLWVSRGILFKSNAVLGRYFRLGRLYGFKTAVHEVMRNPLIVVLEWPGQIEVVKLSSEMRATVNFPVTLVASGAEGGGKFAGKLRDLSPSGCQLAIENPPEQVKRLAKGDQAHLLITFPPESEPTVIKADVRNIQATTSRALLGIKFKPDQPKETQKVANLIKMQLNRE